MQLSATLTATHSAASCSSRQCHAPVPSLSFVHPLRRAWPVRAVERGSSPRAASLELVMPGPPPSSAPAPLKMEWAGTVLAPTEDTPPSRVVQIHSPAELKSMLAADPERLVVLMCKALSCRPCKAFKRKYDRASRKYDQVLFLEVFGDESKELRGLMMELQVRVTPTFLMYRDGKVVHSHVGIKEDKLLQALETQTQGSPLVVENDVESQEAGLGAA